MITEWSCRVISVATSDMHKYSIKIHYGKLCSGYIQACWVGLWEMKQERKMLKYVYRGRGRRSKHLEPLEGLIVVAGLRGVPERLADVTVGPFHGWVPVVGGVRDRVWALGLSGAVLGVVEVEAVADVAEESWGCLLFSL